MTRRSAALCSLLLCLPALANAGEQAIELATPTGTIKGTLAWPAQATQAPVALIIAGSGPTDRDGNSPAAGGRNDSLKLLAAALSRAGMASVRYDKRGVGQSAAAGGAEADLRFEDYVRDAQAWIASLSADPRFTSVSVIGHSEGALIGMLAARNGKVATLTLIAGTSEAAPAVLRRQLAGRLPAGLAMRHEAILTALEQGNTVAEVPPELMVLYRPSVQPYLISWFRYVPTSAMAEVRTPCLILQGGTDIQTRPEDAIALGRAQPGCEVDVIPSMNHIMKRVSASRDEQIASYGDPTLPLAPELVARLTDFLARHTGGLRPGKVGGGA